MALFSSDRAERRSGPRSEPTSLSIIAADLDVVGGLDTRGVIKVEGRVAGNIRAGEQVLVAAGATVEGDVETREAIIGGVVQGGITATERVELLATGVVTGNVMTARLLIHEGAQVNGEMVMRPMDQAHGGSPPTTAAQDSGAEMVRETA